MSTCIHCDYWDREVCYDDSDMHGVCALVKRRGINYLETLAFLEGASGRVAMVTRYDFGCNQFLDDSMDAGAY